MSMFRARTGFRFVLVLLFLGVSGCGKSGGGPENLESPDGSPVLARVGDYLVTAKQVEERIKQSSGKESLESNMANPDIKQIALAAIIDQLCFGKAAEDAGYLKNVKYERAVYLYQTEIVATDYLADTIDQQATPSDEEIRDFYEKNKENYISPVRIAARHIRVSSREKAEQVMKRLLTGEEFAKVAREMSEDDVTRDLGGAVGYVSDDEGVMGLGKDRNYLDAALKLKQGETSPVFEATSGSWYIVYCEEHEGGRLQTVDEVRDNIIRRIKNTGKLADTYNAALAEAREKYKAEIFQGELDKYLGTGDSAERLWEIVDMQPNDRGQLEVLRRISFDFKDNPLADDAQLRMAYILARLGEPRRSEKAIQNLKKRFPKSELIPAADWLLQNASDPALTDKVPTFGDLVARGKG